MKADPRRVAGIKLKYQIPANLEKTSDAEIKTLKEIAENCPVAKSLHPDIEVSIDWGAWS